MAVKVGKLPNNVYTLTLIGPGEHRFTPTSIPEIMAALDEVEADPKAAALVTLGEGKFFSNGLSLSLENRGSMENMQLIDKFHALLKRMLTFPMPTIAAISGHAVAGGCMFALAHDYRFMRADKGFMFLSEIDIKLPFSPGNSPCCTHQELSRTRSCLDLPHFFLICSDSFLYFLMISLHLPLMAAIVLSFLVSCT